MAKSKRSKHMRAMRKILREKLAKKDEVKRLASLKKDALIPTTISVDESPVGENMQMGGNTTLEFNARTLQNKDGQYPSWLSGRQRKRLQARKAVVNRNDKKKKTKTATGKVQKRKVQKKINLSDKREAMST